MWKRVDILREVVREYGKLVITSSEFTGLLDDKGFFEGGDADFRDIVSTLHRSGFGTVLYRISQSGSAEIENVSSWRDTIVNHVNAFCATSHFDSSKVHYVAEVLARGVLPSGCFSAFGGSERLFPEEGLPQEILLSVSDMPVIEESEEEAADLSAPPRKSRINLEKTYPPEYLERQRKRKAQPLEYKKSIITTENRGLETPPSTETVITQSEPSRSVTRSITAPGNQKLSSNIQSSRVSNNFIAFSIIIILAFSVAISVFLLGNKKRSQTVESAAIIAKEFPCPKDSIRKLLDFIRPEDRLLNSEGRQRLENFILAYPTDIWLNFIVNKEEELRDSSSRVNLKFLKPFTYVLPKAQKPKYIRAELIHLILWGKGYLWENAFKSTSKKEWVDRNKVIEGIKHFQRDAGFPADGKLTKDSETILKNWNEMWSSKELGIRGVSKMRLIPGYDSDQLITLLYNSGFLNPSKLPNRPLQQERYKGKRFSKERRADIILMCAKAGLDDKYWYPYDRARLYDVPEDLETCCLSLKKVDS